MASFIARSAFPSLDSLPRSYYLGHHAAGLAKMKTMLNHIDFVIECRDYRVPLTSRNPQFEEALSGWGRQRLIVYTKKDLAVGQHSGDGRRLETMLGQMHAPNQVLFSSSESNRSAQAILSHLSKLSAQRNSLTPSHVLVVGLPNVGKSTLLNALRATGVKKKKAARTGAQPGITRKIATGVKVIEDKEGWEGGDVYLVDTPGVFIPWVKDGEGMLKLAAIGCVKDNIISPYVLADYLLYRINMRDPELYANFCPPTNDIDELLKGIGRKKGWKGANGEEGLEGLAMRLVQRWRAGMLGRFVLDEVNEESIEQYRTGLGDEGMSLSKARRVEKEGMRARTKARVAAAKYAG